MKKWIYLYSLLVAAVLTQVILMRHYAWFPDIIILIVVFTGFFCGGAAGAVFGLFAGIFRGYFSVDTFQMDVLIFPVVGAVSALLGRAFYRHNFIVQVFTVMVSFLFVASAQTLYLNIISDNDIEIPFVIVASGGSFLATVLISPLLFTGLRKLLRLRA